MLATPGVCRRYGSGGAVRYWRTRRAATTASSCAGGTTSSTRSSSTVSSCPAVQFFQPDHTLVCDCDYATVRRRPAREMADGPPIMPWLPAVPMVGLLASLPLKRPVPGDWKAQVSYSPMTPAPALCTACNEDAFCIHGLRNDHSAVTEPCSSAEGTTDHASASK
jgi:hypothetical protein